MLRVVNSDRQRLYLPVFLRTDLAQISIQMYKAGQCWERGRLVRIRFDARFPDIDNNQRLRASRSVRTGRPRSKQSIDRLFGQSPPGHGGCSLLAETHLMYVWDVGNRMLKLEGD